MEKLESLKTFEDACQIEGIDPTKVLPDVSLFPEKDQAALLAHAKLIIIARAANRLVNEGEVWVPDWNDYDQWKYYPYFEMGGSSGFRFYDYDYWFAFSYVGSRLCFKTYEAAQYIGQQFIDLYREYFVI